MKFPNHILLDVDKPLISHSPQYWVVSYLTNVNKFPEAFEQLAFFRRFNLQKEKLLLNNLMLNQKKYTIRYCYTNPAEFIPSHIRPLFKNLYAPRLKVKRRVRFSKHYGKEVYDYMYTGHPTIDVKTIRRLFRNFKFKPALYQFRFSNLWSLFDINFLKKEKIYTKLKYSRVPQYDIVSGGVAAIFSGFLGFLICEKFGFELLDSGDFYYPFMYAVFFIFFIRLYIKATTAEEESWNVLSFRPIFVFYRQLFIIFLRFSSRTFKKFYNRN